MGLDIVEVFMRCEEVFGISIPVADAELAATVGGLYDLVCGGLGLVPLVRPGPGVGVARDGGTWNAEDVWASVRAVVREQLVVDLGDVTYDARWGRDLRAD